MRRTLWLIVALAACAGPDSDPVHVAEEFHSLRVAGDDRGLYALLTEGDRAAVPFASFPTELPTPVMLDLLGWGDATVDSTALVDMTADTARVALHMASGEADTVRLTARREPRKILGLFDRERVTWRVSMRLAELEKIDSLVAYIRSEARATDSTAVEAAERYLMAAEQFPELVRPADLDAANALIRAAEVAEALDIQLRLATANSGVPFVEGRVTNPSGQRINTLEIVVRDATGAEETFELWDIPPNGSVPVWRITRLERGPLSHRVDAIRVF
ncbi:MAG: hypothetical protein R3314_03515 [Longimicrobiales bacterium]|nr:hypothetical protein [Longimicrobiales bacterium]